MVRHRFAANFGPAPSSESCAQLKLQRLGGFPLQLIRVWTREPEILTGVPDRTRTVFYSLCGCAARGDQPGVTQGTTWRLWRR